MTVICCHFVLFASVLQVILSVSIFICVILCNLFHMNSIALKVIYKHTYQFPMGEHLLLYMS